MLTQRVVWTALPNGFTEDRRRLRISLVVSPRLVDDEHPESELSFFPDWLDWPSIAQDARYEMVLNNATVPATVVSTPDSATWRRIFPSDTPVTSRVFEDRRDTKVLGFPVADVERDMADLYGRLAVEAADELPLLDDMRGRFGPLGRGLRALTEAELLEELRHGDGRPPTGDIVRRLGYANLYHTPLSAPEPGEYSPAGPDDPREYSTWQSHALVPLPPATSFKRQIDVHARVSALAQYPALLRLCALVVDLEVDRDMVPDGNDTLAALVGWNAGAGGVVVTEADVLPETAIFLVDDTFEVRSRIPNDPPVVDGHLVLADNGFDVVQLDVNGSALKARQFAIGMFQAPPGRRQAQEDVALADPVADPPDRTGAPALRSGGMTLAMRNRAGDLESRFASSGAMEDAVTAGSPPQLFLEDIVRGFHPEVMEDASGEWRSLVRRDSRITFVSDLDELVVEDNEGLVRLAASAAADGSNPDVVKLYEGLFTWAGWSLSAPPVGRSVGRKDEVKDAASVAPDGLPLEVEHHVRRRSLPSLRFGRRYRLRVRVADLAGNAVLFDASRPSPHRAETEDVEYLRYEPIEAPTFALVGPPSAAEHPSYGEDLATAAIRSLNATPADNAVPTSATVHRHVVPPLGPQQLAERHGMLDLGGRLDPATYSLLVSRDAALAEVPHPVTAKSYPTAAAGVTAPFLPDPLAQNLLVTISGRTSAASPEVVRVPWYPGASTWPDAELLPIEAYEPTDPGDVPEYDAVTGVLRIPLVKADHVRVRVSHEVTDQALRVLGMWRWAREHLTGGAAAQDALLERIREGRHWMFTPWRDLEFVHAVQRPLVQPGFERLKVKRALGKTVAELQFSTPVDSRSTVKLEVFGRWIDPVDDLEEPGPRAQIGGGARAAELPLRRLEAAGVAPPGRRQWLRQPVTHEFGDTRYRRVGYRLTGTTRFTKFMPPPLQEPEYTDDLTVISDETVSWVPNSAAPPAPDVVYVVPTFGWSRVGDDSSRRSWRNGGGLRVYVRRPWLVSGFMEMLGVVLPHAGAAVPPASSVLVTQWGSDPTWTAAGVPASSPSPASFGLSVTSSPIDQSRLDPTIPLGEGDLPPGPLNTNKLTLPGAQVPTTVDVVPHLVRWDPDRQLWYADIVIRSGLEYMPFIRLALARYQPVSADGAHLSPIARAEILQLLPDRMLTMTTVADRVYRIGVYGVGPDQGENLVVLDVERKPQAGGDLSWEILDGVRIRDVPRIPALPQLTHDDARTAQLLIDEDRIHELFLRPDLVQLLRPPLREVEITLPRGPLDGERFRVVVTEFEQRDADAHHLDPEPPAGRDPRRRPVYVETVELT